MPDQVRHDGFGTFYETAIFNEFYFSHEAKQKPNIPLFQSLDLEALDRL
jgi:hypothetical protein